MLLLFIDNDVTEIVVQGVLEHFPEVDLIRTRDVGLATGDDDVLLTWATSHGRVTVSSDANTMIDAAYARLRAGLPMPGLVVVPQCLAYRTAIEDLAAIAICGEPADCENKVTYLPLVK